MLSSAAKDLGTKFAPKYEGRPYEVIDAIGSNIKIMKEGKTHILNSDQIRVYKNRREHHDLIHDFVPDAGGYISHVEW